MKEKLSSQYFPGIALYVFCLIIGLMTYKDYGMGWDEPFQRGPGVLSYNYIFYGSQELFTKPSDNHGAGFELLLVFIEKGLKITDTKAIYEMRHLVTHVFFLLSVLCGYVLVLRLFKNKYLALLAFVMLAFSPRIYAHSFFNSKDLPFLAMFIVTLMLCQMAFEKNKAWLFLLMGIAAGYATSIRIMGSMLFCFIIGFMLIDLFIQMKNKEQVKKIVINILAFSASFLFLLYISWPYIWKSPVHTFAESFGKMSHFGWKGALLFDGKILSSDNPLPWTYFPTWFLISNPPLWLLAGFGGMGLVLYNLSKKPLIFFQNTRERNFLLYVGCFIVPIFAVIILHSVVYDDWRHLYFVYPSFVLMGIYGIDRLLQYDRKMITQAVYGVCILQVAAIGLFMVKSHPFSQVYFNALVSHDDESLRKNYDLEYWGCSFKQALDHITENDTAKVIKVCCIHKTPLDNNIMMMPKEQRDRIVFVEQAPMADYFITNFRLHPDDFPSTNIEYEIQVLNSTILRVYNMHPKAPAVIR
jgi:hypothetical protein